jgi:predicted HicB family RNase H-like nuclease
MNTPMTYRGYCARIEYDDECGVLRGEVLDINDLITFHGDSVGELKAAFHDAIDDYLEHCMEIGRIPEKPYSGKFSVRVTPELHMRAARHAALYGKSINSLVAEALEVLTGSNGSTGATPPRPARTFAPARHGVRRKTTPVN